MLEKPSKFRSAALAGSAIGIVSGVPGLNLINCCCCAGIILGGMLGVYLYREEFREGMPPLESSDGLIVGLLAGIVGAFASTVISLMILLIFGAVEVEFIRGILERVLESLEEAGFLPDEVGDEIRRQLELNLEEAATVTGVLGSLLINLIIYPIFGLLGGLLGYAFFKPKPPLQHVPPTTMG